MSDTISYGEISPRVGVYAVLKLLENALPGMVMQRFGQVTTLPKKRGDTVKWRRYERFAAALAPLAEGVSPTAQPLRARDYTVSLKQYGAWCRITDKCVDMHEDGPLDVAIRQCSDQFKETEERLTIECLKGSAVRYYANGVAGRANVANAVSRGDFRRVARGFQRANVAKINRMVMPTPNANTHGIPDTYIAVCHTDLDSDIRNCTGFISYAEYGDPKNKVDGEIGAIENFRIITSNLVEPYLASGAVGTTNLSNGVAPSSSAAADVYPIICLGQDAYGVVRLQGVNAAHVCVLQPDTPRGGDPLGQRGSVGWKFWHAAKILFEDACAILEVACTANPGA